MLRCLTGLTLKTGGLASTTWEIVEPLVKSITEGLDTRDFAEARQLIEELS